MGCGQPGQREQCGYQGTSGKRGQSGSHGQHFTAWPAYTVKKQWSQQRGTRAQHGPCEHRMDDAGDGYRVDSVDSVRRTYTLMARLDKDNTEHAN